MIILQETLSSQEFKIIPRVYLADSMILKNETTNTSVTIAITPTLDRYFMVIDEVLDLVQDNYYTFTVLNDTDIVYKGIIFCTNQTIADYSVNYNEYIANDTDNDFITI